MMERWILLYGGGTIRQQKLMSDFSFLHVYKKKYASKYMSPHHVPDERIFEHTIQLQAMEPLALPRAAHRVKKTKERKVRKI